ncbi:MULTISPECIES: PAS domain-containing protein [unclassified Nocardioides]|uniref:PAS domain-containing protein n=1 Tax=unclassified Nocardioides TaxID=2615069 RepID=UPI0006FAE026|nr:MULTISPECIES: PAS domain S-box protein [unclassified Nocardioides]KRA30008.1 PAS sensor protein [Nocardioides sp. Root614]KRA86928.1 PAS sensor protein [Nocardioides sp. Root682]
MTSDFHGHPQIAAALLGMESDAIIATDVEGTITLWNPGARRIFGFTSEEALGKSLDIIIPEKLREAHWKGYVEVMKSGESRYGADRMLSVPALTSDGRRISVEFTLAVVLSDAGSVDGTVAVLRDVSKTFDELKELRRAAR